jgi:hypothetical protein
MVTNSFITNIFNQPESALKSGIDNNANGFPNLFLENIGQLPAHIFESSDEKDVGSTMHDPNVTDALPLNHRCSYCKVEK